MALEGPLLRDCHPLDLISIIRPGRIYPSAGQRMPIPCPQYHKFILKNDIMSSERGLLSSISISLVGYYHITWTFCIHFGHISYL